MKAPYKEEIKGRILNKIDEIVKSPDFRLFIIPAKVGIHRLRVLMDIRLRGHGRLETIYESGNISETDNHELSLKVATVDS